MAMREVASAGFDKYLRSFDRLEPATREAAARALAKIDGRILDRLTEEIQALDPERRLRALRVIDYVDAETDLRQNLMALLNDPDRRVRATVIKIVRLAGSEEGMRMLVAALGDPDRRVRANAVEAFEDSGDAQCVPLLHPFLGDPDNRVRANAAKALCTLGFEEGRTALAAMLRHEEEPMRLSAVWAIGIPDSGCRSGSKPAASSGRTPVPTSSSSRPRCAARGRAGRVTSWVCSDPTAAAIR